MHDDVGVKVAIQVNALADNALLDDLDAVLHTLE